MSRMVFAMVACLTTTGCVSIGSQQSAYAPQAACDGNCAVDGCNGRCSDCVPPRVPCWKYMPHVDDFVVQETAKSCACRALARYRSQCGGPISKDFKAGFTRAYIDLAESRTPQPPSIPPSRYWSAYYRSCAGRPHIEDWYAGYRVGLEIGSQSGVSQFNRIEVWPTGCQ
jgi:hypothetical protein